MRSGVHGTALLFLLGILGWNGPAVGTGASGAQSRPPAAARPSSTSWCLAKCVELEVACKAFENRHPTCSPDDICLDEKAQCEAQCRPRVRLNLLAPS
jgi:hypothetical protein